MTIEATYKLRLTNDNCQLIKNELENAGVDLNNHIVDRYVHIYIRPNGNTSYLCVYTEFIAYPTVTTEKFIELIREYSKKPKRDITGHVEYEPKNQEELERIYNTFNQSGFGDTLQTPKFGGYNKYLQFYVICPGQGYHTLTYFSFPAYPKNQVTLDEMCNYIVEHGKKFMDSKKKVDTMVNVDKKVNVRFKVKAEEVEIVRGLLRKSKYFQRLQNHIRVSKSNEYLYFYNDESFGTYDDTFDTNPIILTVPQLVEYLVNNLLPVTETIHKTRLQNLDIVVKPDVSIKAGCTTFNKSDVETLIKLWNTK